MAVWERKSLPVEYGESPIPRMKDCITPEIISILWASKTEEDMRKTLLENVFLFGDWEFRGDKRADIYTDFYFKLIKFVLFFFLFFLSFACNHSITDIAKPLESLQKQQLHFFISFLKQTFFLAVCCVFGSRFLLYNRNLFFSFFYFSQIAHHLSMQDSLNDLKNRIIVPYTFPAVCLFPFFSDSFMFFDSS